MSDTVLHIQCSSCGATIRSEHIHGSIVYCASCQTYKVLSEHSSHLKNVFYKIIRYEHNQKYHLELLLDFMCKNGAANVFDKMKVTKELQRFYLPVREIGTGTNRYYVSLNSSDKRINSNLFDNAGKFPVNKYSMAIKESDMKDLNVNDFKPVYNINESERIEFLPITVPQEKIDVLYHVNQDEMLVVKYLPVFVMETNKCIISCLGKDANFCVLNQQEVCQAIRPTRKKRHLEITREDLIGIVSLVGGILLVGGIIYFIYTLFTGGHFFKTLFGAIGFVFLAIWSIICLAIYALAIGIAIAPGVKFVYILIENLLKEKLPNKRKGLKVLGLR